jgi:hypothetical protein
MPDYYLYKFEFERLEFSSTGSVKNMDDNVSQMMIGNFFILKILIKTILFHPDYNFEQEGMTDVNISENCQLKLKQISCYIYYMYLVDIVEDNNVIPNNTGAIKDKTRIPALCEDELIYGNFLKIMTIFGRF